MLLSILAVSFLAVPVISGSSGSELDTALVDWRAAHGDEWQVREDRQTDSVRFLYGGHTEGTSNPLEARDFAELARVYIDEAYGLLGVSSANLVLDEVLRLPLGALGSSDKMTVQFRQYAGGVRVERGLVTALFDLDGRLLSLDSVGLPDALLPASTRVTRSSEAAEVLALEAFINATGLAAADVEELGLVVVQEEVGSARQGTLAWRFRIGNESDLGSPQAFIYAVTASGPLRVAKAESQIHFFDVGGNVQVMATSGYASQTAGNPPSSFPAGYMRVTSPQAGTTFTDAFGNFNFVGATGPITATFAFDGTFNDVNSQTGANYSLTSTLATGTSNSVLLNAVPTALVLAQANCFIKINAMRDWTRSINPLDDKSDFVAVSEPNTNSACNAFYSGSATKYMLAGSGCVNTAFSSVIFHEMGHWMNDQYSSGNDIHGFGEGNADVFAMYQTDSPIIGDGFFGPGTFMRTGENNRQFCGDNAFGCFFQAHADGEVLMGALWKVRARLNVSLGDAAGDALSNGLFNGWMNAYNDAEIETLIETHWLVLDDDDGDLGNGTPHFDEINGGFTDQGFPGVELTFLDISNVTGPVDTIDENGPYGVSAVVVPVYGTAVASADLFFRVDGGPSSSIPMTAASGDRFFATIPGQASPSLVEWWIEVSNDLGQANRFPLDGPLAPSLFRVGQTTSFFFDDLELAGDNGWSHGFFSVEDDWQHGKPKPKGFNPMDAFSGLRVWGNTLGSFGSDGYYAANVQNYLRAPLIDLTGSVGAKLSYRRWLTVEDAAKDQASIFANGVKVWENPVGIDTVDTAWVLHEVDLAAFDGQMVQLDWRLAADGDTEFSGWTIDDVSVLSVASSPSMGLPTYFGVATPGSTQPTLDTAGQPALIGNADFVAVLKSAPSETAAFLALGFAQINIPLLGITQLVLPASIFTGQTNLFGEYSVSIPIPNDPALVGLAAFFQALVVDAGGPQGFSATGGMQILVTP